MVSPHAERRFQDSVLGCNRLCEHRAVLCGLGGSVVSFHPAEAGESGSESARTGAGSIIYTGTNYLVRTPCWSARLADHGGRPC